MENEIFTHPSSQYWYLRKYVNILITEWLAQIPCGTDRCKTFIRTLNSSNECFCPIKDEKNCDWVSHKWVTSYLRYYHGKTYDIRKWKQSSQNDEIYNFEWIEWSILFSSFNPYEFNGNSNILRWMIFMHRDDWRIYW